MFSRKQLADAILHLDKLMSDETEDEAAYQTYFEMSPVVFELLGYKKHVPFTKASGNSLPRDENTGLQPEPDFLVQRNDGLCEIFEIKTPGVGKLVLDRNPYRVRFTADLNSYIQQTITYAEYFSGNYLNRQEVLKRHGLEVQGQLDIKIVVGRNTNIDREQVQQLQREFVRKIDIMTYDDIMLRLTAEYQSRYGIFEDVPGFSFHFTIRRAAETGVSAYLLDIGTDAGRNRISFYWDEQGDLCLAVRDDGGRRHLVRVDYSASQSFEEWHYVACEIGATTNAFMMTASLNGVEKERIVRNSSIRLAVDFSQASIVLGCDCNRRNFATFDIQEHIIYAKTLDLRGKQLLLDNMTSQFNPRPVGPYVRFSGKQYLYRDQQLNFVQPIASLQPMFKTTEMGVETQGPLTSLYNQGGALE